MSWMIRKSWRLPPAARAYATASLPRTIGSGASLCEPKYIWHVIAHPILAAHVASLRYASRSSDVIGDGVCIDRMIPSKRWCQLRAGWCIGWMAAWIIIGIVLEDRISSKLDCG